MHQSPASPTSVKIILAIKYAPPEKIEDTISKSKIPTLPQLIAPIITRARAILSNAYIFIYSVFIWAFRPINIMSTAKGIITVRARKKKHGAERLAACDKFFIHDASAVKGHWSEVFGNSNEIRLEIGCGKGRFIIESAKREPGVNFIGIEKVPDIVMMAGEKLMREELPNVRLINADAATLPDCFEKGEISRIYLNFSDPWKKGKQAKRRLTYHTFLSGYRAVLPVDGKLEFKTDNRPLFDFSVEEMTAYGWKLSELCYDLHASEYEKNNVHTEYEDNFSAKGFAINRVVGTPPTVEILPPPKKKKAEDDEKPEDDE